MSQSHHKECERSTSNLIDHLLTSDCSECVAAGERMADLRDTTTRSLPRRMWINQPSTSQQFFRLHGENVLAVAEDVRHWRVYFLSGDTVSCVMHANCLSPGWKTGQMAYHVDITYKDDFQGERRTFYNEGDRSRFIIAAWEQGHIDQKRLRATSNSEELT